MISERRHLTFASLAEVMPEVDRLLKGHRTVGQWSLGQICNHLSSSIVRSVDGFPFQAPWIFRKTIGPLMLGRFLKQRKFPTGIKIPEDHRPRSGLDDRAEAEALRAAISLFGSHSGPYAESPIAGSMTRATWEQFHAIHCAHHLSFALPEPERSPAGRD